MSVKQELADHLKDHCCRIDPASTNPLTESVAFLLTVGDETTGITTDAVLYTFRAPFAFTLTEVRASLNVASAVGDVIIDINEAGTSVLSTKLTIDATELTSQTSVAPWVISDTAIADDAEIEIEIDQHGDDSAAGLKVWILGTKLI